jgi:hypothetical protein
MKTVLGTIALLLALCRAAIAQGTNCVALTMLLTLCGLAPATAQTTGSNCQQSAIYDASTSGSTKLVTGAGNTRIFVCGFDFFSGGTVSLKLVYGTGGTCGTGTASITPAFQFVAQTGIVDPSAYWRGLTVVPAGNDLCINASSGIAAQAIVYYLVMP